MVTAETWKGLGFSTLQADFQVGLCTVTGVCWGPGDQGINEERGFRQKSRGLRKEDMIRIAGNEPLSLLKFVCVEV